jgi:hypothetical protein
MRRYTFDCATAGHVIDRISGLLSPERDPGAQFTITVFGPGGGNPEVDLERVSDTSAPAVEAFLRRAELSWIDAEGMLHDAAPVLGGTD